MPIVARTKHWTLCSPDTAVSAYTGSILLGRTKHQTSGTVRLLSLHHLNCNTGLHTDSSHYLPQVPNITFDGLSDPTLFCQSRAGPNVAKIDKSGTDTSDPTSQRYHDLAPDIHDG